VPEEEVFFDLTKEQVAELGIVVVETEDGCRVGASTGEIFEIVNTATPDERRDPKLYTAMLAQTGHVGERETCELLDPLNGKTAGYVFPLTAFRDTENFDGMWLRRYADVAFRAATSRETISQFSAGISIESLRDRRLFLDEVLDDSLSIVVLGNAARELFDVDNDTLEFMLFKQGVHVVRSRADLLPQAPGSEWRTRLKLVKPDDLVASEAAVFLNLLKSADRDRLGVGAFMHLYQALEFCIDHIFGWGVEKIANEGLDTWDMKAELSKITGESYRLGLLDSQYLPGLPSRSVLNDLAQESREFLAALGVGLDPDATWHKLLYKCRNIIVHNQIMMLKTDHVPLRDLVITLRAASMEILFSFTKPAAGVAA
jgi:hypothetical protein